MQNRTENISRNLKDAHAELTLSATGPSDPHLDLLGWISGLKNPSDLGTKYHKYGQTSKAPSMITSEQVGPTTTWYLGPTWLNNTSEMYNNNLIKTARSIKQSGEGLTATDLQLYEDQLEKTKTTILNNYEEIMIDDRLVGMTPISYNTANTCLASILNTGRMDSLNLTCQQCNDDYQNNKYVSSIVCKVCLTTRTSAQITARLHAQA